MGLPQVKNLGTLTNQELNICDLYLHLLNSLDGEKSKLLAYHHENLTSEFEKRNINHPVYMGGFKESLSKTKKYTIKFLLNKDIGFDSLSDSVLLRYHVRLHGFFSKNYRNDNFPEEDLVRLHTYVVKELKNRDIKHSHNNSKLDKIASLFSEKPPEVVEISIDEVKKNLQSVVVDKLEIHVDKSLSTGTFGIFIPGEEVSDVFKNHVHELVLSSLPDSIKNITVPIDLVDEKTSIMKLNLSITIDDPLKEGDNQEEESGDE